MAPPPGFRPAPNPGGRVGWRELSMVRHPQPGCRRLSKPARSKLGARREIPDLVAGLTNAAKTGFGRGPEERQPEKCWIAIGTALAAALRSSACASTDTRSHLTGLRHSDRPKAVRFCWGIERGLACAPHRCACHARPDLVGETAKGWAPTQWNRRAVRKSGTATKGARMHR